MEECYNQQLLYIKRPGQAIAVDKDEHSRNGQQIQKKAPSISKSNTVFKYAHEGI